MKRIETIEIHEYPKEKPCEGQNVIWVWREANQVATGDFYQGKPRDASRNYKVITKKNIMSLPSHWIDDFLEMGI